jgi:hypothetical protein
MFFFPRIRLRDRLVARVRRFTLDRQLAGGASPDSNPALLLRAHALISERERRRLARALRRSSRLAGRGPLVAHAPLDRDTLLGAGEELDTLASRLVAPGPVDARGVASTRLLLSDVRSPLFRRRSGGALRERLATVREALDPDVR